MGLQTLLLFFLALAATAQGQTPAGFISIDCGVPDGNDYQDPTTRIKYSSDAGYIDTGVNLKVSSSYNMGTLARRYSDLRSFPNGTRNCYTLSPVLRGVKILVRAWFVYGNYDGLNLSPTFDLYLGVNLWQTVSTADTSVVEILAVAPASSLQVCLVNTGNGTPFVSVLELRPLLDSMYTLVNGSTQALVLHQLRQDHGGSPNGQIRYPDDPYDRVWYAAQNRTGWTPISTNSVVAKEPSGQTLVPSAVLRTAVTTAAPSQSLNFTVPGRVGQKIHVFMHFAELRRLEANESREFNVYSNASLWYGPYSPVYLQAGLLETNRAGGGGAYTYSLDAAGNSTLPPILNALEVYSLQQLTALPTNDTDVDAILRIKVLYQVERNWIGDPCFPENFTWEGLNCSYDDSESPRIISLNLSSSGLAGGIPAPIANLTALKTLDLSHNNFTGEIPGYLAELPALHFLSLASNQLTGTVPENLAKKSQEGSLLLSMDDNPNLCDKAGSCEVEERKKKWKILVPIMTAVSIFLVLLLAILILIWVLKRRKKPDVLQRLSMKQPGASDNSQMQNLKDNLKLESYPFTFSEIVNITNNFGNAIGRGGFGIVYHGYLNDRTQVAVKMLSNSSSQGAKEFQAEAQILTKVHHKSLVSLIGFCNDKNNLALVYEFMSEGSLAKHLSGNSDNANGLTWRVRLGIALEAALGLDYLHNGCNPPIVHRDVKTANILLNQNFRAKLADFGVSKVFPSEDLTHISTAVVGTPGYLDPEYYRTYRLNEKSDVFSFGVVLLQLITGQPPIFNGPAKIHIVQWVGSWLERGDINSIADPRMLGDYDANSLWKAVEVAMSCTSSASIERPTMCEVVMQLKDCLASDAGGGISHDASTLRPDSIEMAPPNSGTWVCPSAR